MKPTRNEFTTRELGKPVDWDDEKMGGPCDALPIVDAHGMMFSYWRASWRERIAILCGRPVRLGIVGRSHPVVSVDTAKV
jgi:hypothetical protein